jgi:energy-coupling factor transporter ATP-binding protein EcfA2
MSEMHVNNLTFSYLGEKQPVLQDINLKLKRGEFILVAGPSGCGKSTLSLALAGLIPLRIPGRIEGSVYYGDKCIKNMDIHEISQHIGMVFQNPDNQLVHLDVESEVAFGPENLGLPKEEVRERVEQSLKSTGMERFRNSTIYSLSGGQKQRIAISATLAMRPEVLILDEPTSDLDPAGTQEVLSVLRNLNQQHGITIILIEHKIDEVIPWVNRVVLMDKGKIIKDSTPRSAFNDQKVWNQLGVSIPEIVLLSSKFPNFFGGETALTVQEAYDALKGSEIQSKLIADLSLQNVRDPFYVKGKMPDPILNWEDVRLKYDKRQVLKGTNLSFAAGEWIALVGSNGSGKTSLASLAMGFQAPTSGSVSFYGKAVKPGKISRQAAKIGYLFQAADNMLFTPNVEKELAFGINHRRKGKSMLDNMTINNFARLFDLEESLHKNPFQLSHGQRKRLAIGALVVSNPSILILDEPTTGQDEGHARAFLEFLQSIRMQWQMSYLMITHDMRAVANYASRMVVLYDGNIAISGPPTMVFSNIDTLSAANIIPPPIAHLHSRLCEGRANKVALNIHEFICSANIEEVLV